jgi:hypothetical protein
MSPQERGTVSAEYASAMCPAPDYLRVLGFTTDGDFQKSACVAVFMPEGHNAWMSLGYAGLLGTVTAMNEKGLAIGEKGNGGDGRQRSLKPPPANPAFSGMRFRDRVGGLCPRPLSISSGPFSGRLLRAALVSRAAAGYNGTVLPRSVHRSRLGLLNTSTQCRK